MQKTCPESYTKCDVVRSQDAAQAADRLEKRKADAKNEVEEYVYLMRDKLAEQLVDYVSEAVSLLLSLLFSSG